MHKNWNAERNTVEQIHQMVAKHSQWIERMFDIFTKDGRAYEGSMANEVNMLLAVWAVQEHLKLSSCKSKLVTIVSIQKDKILYGGWYF